MVGLISDVLKVRVRWTVCLFGLGMILLAAAYGQEGLSTLRGTVTDASGAVIPGAEIVAREVLTNVTARTVKSRPFAWEAW